METDIRLIFKPEYERIVKRVLGHRNGFRQNIALLGRPFIGKTFLISRVLDNLPQDMVSVVLDGKKIDPAYLFRAFFSGLLTSYTRGREKECPKDLDGLMTVLESRLPSTLDLGKQYLNRRVDLRVLFMVLDVFTRESGRKVLFVLENFESLERWWGKDVYLLIAEKIMEMKDVMFIVSSSSIKRAREILRSDLSLLFGNFEEIVLEPVSPLTCRDYMERALPFLSSGLRKFLYKFTGGSPFYMDILCRRLWEQRNLGERNEIEVVKEILFEQVFSEYGLIYQHFMRLLGSLTDGPKGPQVPTFLLVSAQEPRLSALTERFGWGRNVLDHKVDVLQEKGLIYVDHDSLFFEDCLFRFWVKNVYRMQIEGAGLGEEVYKERAMALLDEEIKTFLQQDKEGHLRKILCLFKRFRDEFVVLPNGKKRRFYEFESLMSLDEKLGIFQAQTKAGYRWIFSYRPVWQESDAFEYKGFLESLEVEPHRKILISLAEVSSPVKVIAKETGMWIWDYKVLSHLFSLYGIGELTW